MKLLLLQDLKHMLNNLDLSKLEEIEKQRMDMAVRGQAEGGAAGSGGATYVGANFNKGGITKQYKLTGQPAVVYLGVITPNMFKNIDRP